MPPVEPPGPPPALPTSSSGKWWLTTVLGIVGAVLPYVAQMVPSPWNEMLLSIAAAIAGTLGVSHSGNFALRPGPRMFWLAWGTGCAVLAAWRLARYWS